MELKMLGSNPLQVSETTFGREYNEALVHQVVVAYMNYARQGSKAQLTRSEVSGGGRKPFRQKGTGRARAGSIRSPIWRGGAKAFAAAPQNWEQKVNRKMYRVAIRSILSELVRQDRLVVVENFGVDEIKTKALVKKLNELSLRDVLIVTPDFEEKLALSARNLYKVDVCSVQGAGFNPVSLISHEKVLVTSAAVRKIEEILA